MGQRTKEIALLVLALAFLAVAVFTIRGKREPVVPPAAPEGQAEATAEETAEPGTEEAESAEEQAATEEAGTVRNPFALPGTSAAAPVEPAEQIGDAGEPMPTVAALPEGELRLTGIVAGLAVIRVGERRHYVRAGDRVGDYRVQSVGQHEVVLSSEAGQITLRTGGRQVAP